MTKDDSRLVYSTASGRVCPQCSRPAARCACRPARRKPSGPPPGEARDGGVRIRRETKGRKGKTVTVVVGLPLDGPALEALARDLKQQCGAGGSVVDGRVVVQGDHRERLVASLQARGYTVKAAGG